MSIGELNSKLKDRIKQDRLNLEQIAKNEFAGLQRSLNESSKSALATIEADIAVQVQAMSEKIADGLGRLEKNTMLLQKALLSSWMKAATVGLFVFLGAALGAWGVSRTVSGDIQELLAQRTELQQQKEGLEQEAADLKQTIARMQQKTWGIQLMDTEKGRFIVLPPKTKIVTGWSVGEKDAIKLE